MKIVLETTDLLRILGLHLGRELAAEQVTVQTDPVLQIEIDGAVAVEELASGKHVRSAVPEATPRTVYMEAGSKPAENAEDSGMSIRDLLTYSRQIEEGIQSMPRR